MAGTLPEEKAALWFRSLPAAEEALRVVSWDPGGEKVQFGVAKGTNLVRPRMPRAKYPER